MLHQSHQFYYAVALTYCMGVSPIAANTAYMKPLPPEHHAKATQLNMSEKLLLQQLDQLKSIAQYLLQVTHQKPFYKTTRVWLSGYLKRINALKSMPLYPITEEKLAALTGNTTILVDQLDTLLENNLESIPQSTKHLAQKPTLHDIEDEIYDNESRLEVMREKTRQAGLTFTNKVFRAIDAIVPSLSEVSFLALLSAFVLNALPKTRLRERILGTSEDLTQNNPYSLIPQPLTALPPHISLMGKFVVQTIGLFTLYSQASKAIELLPITTQKSLRYGLYELYRIGQNEWENLKGNDIAIMPSTYETIENLTLDDDDLIGLEDQKSVILSIINYLIDPELFIRQGTKIEKAILFTGPSRSGKTALARRIAGQANKMFAESGKTNRILFRSIRPHELSQEGSMESIIKEVKERRRPCIIFIDEFHAIGAQIHQDRIKLADALTALEDLHQIKTLQHPIFVIAATNRPDLLDPALLTHERFGNTVHFRLPSFENRRTFFETKLRRIAADTQEFDLDLLGHKTERCSYGDLQKAFNEARLATNNIESIKQHHLITAIDQTIRGILNTIPTELRTKHIVAAHYAGYSLAYTLLDPYERLDIVTIRGTTQKIFEVNEWTEPKGSDKNKQHKISFGAIFTYRDDEQIPASDKNELIKQIKICLSGKVAEDILLGSHSLTYHGLDSSSAFDIAKIILLDGFLEKDLSKQAREKLADNARTLVEETEVLVRKLFEGHKNALEAIFKALEEQHYLTATEVTNIVNQYHQ